ncbi:MAG: hypothetical protein HYU52_03125 [Acidobacteria bacterium]|nr:hypothetical protein [Acidobacteriota bacterium]
MTGLHGEDALAGAVRIIGQFRFAPGSDELLPASRALLDRYAMWLARVTAGERFYIETARHGGDAAISGERGRPLGLTIAEAVRRYLCTKLAVPMDRAEIVATGAGIRAAVSGDHQRHARSRVVVLVLR